MRVLIPSELGVCSRNPETAEGIASIRMALTDSGFIVEAVDPPDATDILQTIHDSAYLEEIIAFSENPDASPNVPDSIRSYADEDEITLTPEIIKAAKTSFNLAIFAAERLKSKQEDLLALTCSPGHHAGPSHFGNHCYFNNAAGAALVLSKNRRVVVLDLAYHIGDGLLDYTGPWIRYFSLHADPVHGYPYKVIPVEDYPYARLLSLPENCDGATYRFWLDRMLMEIEQEDPSYLIVLVDFGITHNGQAVEKPFCFELPDFQAIGDSIATLPYTKLFLLESAGTSGSLEANVSAFFSAFLDDAY